MGRRRITFVASLALVALLANSVATGADPVKKPAAQPTDLRPAMKSMTWKQGKNVIHKGAGHTLAAEVRDNKFVGWSATDDKGNPLQTTAAAKGVYCQICITGPFGSVCYLVDCDKIPLPKPDKSPT